MPWLSAGWITVRTWSSRAAANNSVSASGPSSLPMPDSTRWRMISAPGEPPGSRVTMARNLAASRRSASLRIWVDFPEPSPPSNVMKRPRRLGRWIAASAMSELRGAGTEHADDEFLGTVERTAHRRSGADSLRREDRLFHRDIAATPNPHDADLLARRDRRLDRTAIDNPREQRVVAVLRHQHLDWIGADELDRAALAAEHPGIADRLIGRDQRPGFKTAEAPFQHLLGFGGAIVRILKTVDHDDQPRVVLHRRADHAVAALLGVAGLQPIGAGQGLEQRIAVLLADLVPGELLLAEQSVHVRIGLDDVARERRELPHRHLVGGIWQPVGIAEGRFGHAELAGALGHEVGRKSMLVAGDAFGERDAGIVAARDDRAVQEVVDRDIAVDRREHRRGSGRRPAPPPGVLADPVLVRQLDVALLDGVEHHLDRHQLHHAGGRAQFVGVLLEQHAAAGGLDQDRGRGIAVEAALFLLGALDAVVGGMDDPAATDADHNGRHDQAAPASSGASGERAGNCGLGCHWRCPERLRSNSWKYRKQLRFLRLCTAGWIAACGKGP